MFFFFLLSCIASIVQFIIYLFYLKKNIGTRKRYIQYTYYTHTACTHRQILNWTMHRLSMIEHTCVGLAHARPIITTKNRWLLNIQCLAAWVACTWVPCSFVYWVACRGGWTSTTCASKIPCDRWRDVT